MSTTSYLTALWVVNSAQWEPSDDEFNHLVDKYCDRERAASVRKFHFQKDKLRALLSTMLQRKACSDLAGADPHSLVLARTKGKKPYGVLGPNPQTPNFSFNVSHDGEYVGISAHSHYLCGCDVLEHEADAKKVSFLAATLSAHSNEYYQRLPARLQPGYLQLLFGCKEAYTKAVGVGLFEEFSGISFKPHVPGHWAEPFEGTLYMQVHVTVRPEPQTREQDKGSWLLEATWIDHKHVAVTAVGCPRWAVDAHGGFKKQFQQPSLQPSELEGPSFGAPRVLRLRECIPPADWPEFQRRFRPNAVDEDEDDDLGIYGAGDEGLRVEDAAETAVEDLVEAVEPLAIVQEDAAGDTDEDDLAMYL